MSAPAFYDASSPNERDAPPLPCAPPVRIDPCSALQPPLSRRGAGPGLVLVLPNDSHVQRRSSSSERPLDPEPMQKWAEEGFAVVAITMPEDRRFDVIDGIAEGVKALREHPNVDVKDKFGLVVYDDQGMVDAILEDPSKLQKQAIAAITTFSRSITYTRTPIPVHAHISRSTAETKPPPYILNVTFSAYPDTHPQFVIPSATAYDPPSAGPAHSRSLAFLREHLGGPVFDLEAVWEEHTYWEFEKRSVARTMATMVAEPYVNHVPTMTGGMGRAKLTAFYRDHFIFCNPPDTSLKPISRNVGPDRIVDEFIFSCTHSTPIPWLLPNVPPTHTRLAIPMVAVVNIRGDRLCHEHIWWDQATVLRQAGILPTHLPFGGAPGGLLKLPVAGSECARLLADERDGTSNEMIGDDN